MSSVIFIYRLDIWVVFLLTLLFVIMWGIICSVIGLKSEIYLKRINSVIFALCFLGVLYITVFSRERGDYTVNLVPFDFFAESKNEPEIFRSMFMNIILFVPFGAALPYAFEQKRRRGVFYTIIVSLFISVFIECMQFVFSLGNAEADDVICNTLGAAAGTASYFISRLICCRLRPEKEKNKI